MQAGYFSLGILAHENRLLLEKSTCAAEGFHVPRRVRPCRSETRHMRQRAFMCLDACGPATRKLDICDGSLSRASTRVALPLGNSTDARAAFHVPRRVRPYRLGNFCLDACGPADRKLDMCEGRFSTCLDAYSRRLSRPLAWNTARLVAQC